MRHLVLLGLMGSGKSTVGARVAQRLGLVYLDGDEQLTALTGATAAEFAANDGLERLHELEADVALGLLARPGPTIIGLAASVVDDPRVLPALRYAARTVWLDAPVEQLVARVGEKPHRPLPADVTGLLTRQREERGPRFAAAADMVLEVEKLTADEAADAVAAFYAT
jgi:shikimate kinase